MNGDHRVDLQISKCSLLAVFEISLLGTDAAERKDIVWTVSSEDHPARILYLQQHKTRAGSSIMVGLSKRVVS